MSLRADAGRAHPNFPWLDPDRTDELQSYLVAAGFLGEGEPLTRCTRAGAGNMNLTLWIETPERQFVLKQARPWVEKFDHIAAPWDRNRFEARFYQKAATLAGVGDRMPRLLGSDPAAQVLLLEALADSTDLNLAYSRDTTQGEGSTFSTSEIKELAAYLAALHGGTRGLSSPELANDEMRALNFEHIFVVPFAEDNGVDLEALEPGLGAAAAQLREDPELRRTVEETGEHYQRGEACLVHGDYFPGSWLRTGAGLRIIDPEFGFPGEPEIDLGCAIAHLALAEEPAARAKQFLDSYEGDEPGAVVNRQAMARYAAAEVIRRLIGVAQLPIPVSPTQGPARNRRKQLLARARRTMLGAEATRLFNEPPSLL